MERRCHLDPVSGLSTSGQQVDKVKRELCIRTSL